MERKGGSKRKKVRSTGVPSLLIGVFLGFVIGLVAVGGVGAYLYFNVSVNWLNSAFNTDYDLGNDDLNNTTISEFVTHVIGLSQNLDGYTLNDLEIDFGVEIGDEVFGINISSLKNVPFSELEEAVKDKIASLSADDLSEMVDFSELTDLLNANVTYYYNTGDGELYVDADYGDLVDFDYTYNNGKITIGENSFTISTTNTLIVQLKYLPLSTALNAIFTDITVAVMFGTDANSGVLLLVKDSTFESLPTDLNAVLTSSTLSDLIDCGALTAPDNYTTIAEKYLKINLGTGTNPEYKQVKNLTIEDLIYALDYILNAESGTYLSTEIPTA